MKLGKQGERCPGTLPHECSYPTSQEQPLLHSLQCQLKGTLSRTAETCPLNASVTQIRIIICHNSLGFTLWCQQSCQSIVYTQADKICLLQKNACDFSQRMTETESGRFECRLLSLDVHTKPQAPFIFTDIPSQQKATSSFLCGTSRAFTTSSGPRKGPLQTRSG